MARIPRLKPGDYVRIDFLDHVEDGDLNAADLDTEMCCFGRVKRLTKRAIIVEGWGYSDFDRDATESNSTKHWTIIKRAVQRVTLLEPKHEAE